MFPEASVEATATNAKIITAGMVVHPAWHIAWEASDVSALSPRPPDLVSSPSLSYTLYNEYPEQLFAASKEIKPN